MKRKELKRKEFLAAVHELAEQLGSRLYDLVQGESDRLRAAALEVATAELRGVVGTASPGAAPPETSPSDRAPRRCKVCGEFGHNARRHRERATSEERPVEPSAAAVGERTPAAQARRERFARIEAARRGRERTERGPEAG